MSQSTKSISQTSTDPLKLTASAVNYLLKILPKGTAYCIGIVLVVMMTGRLVQSKGSLARAGKAIKAKIMAAVTTVVFIAGVGVGLVRRVRFGDSCEAAVAEVVQDLPESQGHRLLVVDAGIATHKQFAAASDKTEEIWSGYKHRSPVETNFYVAQDSAGMEMPRAWTLERY